jgi:type IV pilus assembly protein PilE
MKNGPAQCRGFTLIELMIVIAIGAMIMTIGIPSFMRSLKKAPLSQADSDVIEACSHARAQAIFSGRPAELRILPRERQFIVEPAPPEPEPSTTITLNLGVAPAPTPAAAANTTIFRAQLSEEITIEMIDVNLREYKDADEARVRFYPNGTAEELTVVLQYHHTEYHKISVDMVTGLADMEPIK